MVSFKPRIFISSTFKENEHFRNSIEKFLKSIGAEPVLYEKNITPSIWPKVYRQSIIEADFVILVIRDNYGTLTNSGLSGIHEEYRIAMANNIPTHVYIFKSDSKSVAEVADLNDNVKSLNKLIKEIEINGNSYFYFKKESELIKRIKETTFSIAKDIVERINLKREFSRSEASRISLRVDYSNAFPVIYILRDLFEKVDKGMIDYIKYDAVSNYTEKMLWDNNLYENYFIKESLNEKFNALCKCINEFNIYQGENSIFKSINKLKLEIKYLGKIELSSLDHVEKYGRIDYVKYKEMFNKLKEAFKEFEQQAMEINLQTEMTEIYD